MSEQPAQPAPPLLQLRGETAGERALIRIFAATALLAWPAALMTICGEATHLLKLADVRFSILIAWLIGTGCLGAGVSMMRAEHSGMTRILSKGLRFGDPALDDVLIPQKRRWRSHPRVRHLIGYVAAVDWVLALAYSYQFAVGTYDVRLVISLFTLVFFLVTGIWATVIGAAGGAEARREAGYDLACAAHWARRAEQERLRELAEGAALADIDGDEGQVLHLIKQSPGKPGQEDTHAGQGVAGGA
jgi:hypothetical protein